MKQKINLYQEEFWEKKVVLSSGQVFTGFFSFLGFVALVTMLMSWDLYRTEKYNDELAINADSLKLEVETLSKQMNSQEVDPRLQRAVIDAEKQLAAKKDVLALVGTTKEIEQARFSALLSGLARQHVNGIWLTDIRIYKGGSHMQLEGGTMDPALIPEFIGSLNGEDVYIGREFKAMAINRHEEGASIVGFVLSTAHLKSSMLVAMQP